MSYKGFRFSVVLVLLSFGYGFAQEKGVLQGDLMANSAFYIDDPRLGQFGTNTTQYKNEKSSAEAWLFLNYKVKGYTFSARYDMFHNSALLNPTEAYTNQGMPFYSIEKSFDKLTITAGSFYDQFGSGVLFRAYEDRVIGLDFAMQGLKLEYQLTENLRAKAFSGKQKNRFEVYPQVVQGINIEGARFGRVGLTYGASGLKRTLDFEDDVVNRLVPIINALNWKNRFVPRTNVYGGQAYGSATLGNFSFNIDLAAKTAEATFDYNQDLLNEPGYYGMAGLSYATKGLGINVLAKYSENFNIRTNPFTAQSTFLTGTVGFLAPVNRQNTYRLPARYSPAVQEQGEIGIQADINYAINRKNVFNVNFSYIEAPTIIDETLFQEIFATYTRKFSRKFKGTFGYQNVLYNQKIYEGKDPSTPTVKTHVPFVEFLWKMKKKKSLRTEFQFLMTDEDLGDFAYGLIEFNVAPKYSFSVSDMVNTNPREKTRNPLVAPDELVHYPTVFIAYTKNQTRLTAGYIKQVEGIVCTGGVCRLEPAFSGIRFGLTTNF